MKSKITNEQYSKLNNYLNELCLGLSEKDNFFLTNTRFFGMISAQLLDIFDDYNLTDDKKEDCFTFFEIYEKTKEVLKSIDPEFLEDFEKLIPEGRIEANYNILDIPYYERKMENSFFTPHDETIHMGSSFNYDAIPTLIHEYMHRTNKSNNLARYLLTEYISIYFELYTYDYLQKQGIDKEKLNLSSRFEGFIRNLKFIDDVSFLLYTYDRLGDFNENTHSQINYARISKEDFDDELIYNLKRFEDIEKDYNNRIDKENKESFREFITDIYNVDYRYVFGTILAYYSFYHLSKDNVLRLNKAIKNDIVTTLDDALKTIGLELDDNTINETINCIIRYIEENNLSKREEKVK